MDDREKLYPTCGKLHPEGLIRLAKCEDYDHVKAVADCYPVSPSLSLSLFPSELANGLSIPTPTPSFSLTLQLLCCYFNHPLFPDNDPVIHSFVVLVVVYRSTLQYLQGQALIQERRLWKTSSLRRRSVNRSALFLG